MPIVIGAIKRLELLRTQPQLKDKLWEITHALQNGLRERGFDIGTTQSCVTPVLLKGQIPDAAALTIDLRENYNIFCSIVVYPVVPKDIIMLRLIPTAVHTLDDVAETIKAFEKIAEKLDKGQYSKSAVPA